MRRDVQICATAPTIAADLFIDANDPLFEGSLVNWTAADTPAEQNVLWTITKMYDTRVTLFDDTPQGLGWRHKIPLTDLSKQRNRTLPAYDCS